MAAARSTRTEVAAILFSLGYILVIFYFYFYFVVYFIFFYIFFFSFFFVFIKFFSAISKVVLQSSVVPIWASWASRCFLVADRWSWSWYLAGCWWALLTLEASSKRRAGMIQNHCSGVWKQFWRFSMSNCSLIFFFLDIIIIIYIERF